MNKIKNHKEIEERLKSFALRVLKLVKTISKTDENRIYGKQILRSSSSVGANYAEAIYAHTKQDFLNNINICRKEANETYYWLEMICAANPYLQKGMTELLDENKQILKIFISSVKTTKINQQNTKQ